MELYTVILLGIGSSLLLLVIANTRGVLKKIFLAGKSAKKIEGNSYEKDQQKLNKIDFAQDQRMDKGVIHYSQYKMSTQMKLLNILLASGVLFLIGYIFYQKYVIALILAVLGTYYPKVKVSRMINKRKQQLNLQFKQALHSLSSSLSAGKSVENSFREVSQDLRFLYPDSNTYIIKEFELISRRIDNGENIEQAILDLAERSGIEDIQNFADVFSTCKRTGGDLVEVIRRTAEIIGEKLEIQQDIHVIIAQKRLESRILMIAPFIIVAALGLGSPDYMEPLYTEPMGFLVMSIALAGNVIAYFWVTKIMDIKV